MSLTCPNCENDDGLHVRIPLAGRVDGGSLRLFPEDTELRIDCDECVKSSRVYAEQLDTFDVNVEMEWSGAL